MENQKALVPTKQKEWTAWQLYRREHSDQNPIVQLAGFIACTLSIIAVIFGGLCTLQGYGAPTSPIALALGIFALTKLTKKSDWL